MSQPSWIGYHLGGRYIIEELLGQGGMSTVYRATDPNLRRPVAVKLIHPHLSSNAEFVRRFEEEAAAVAQLNHPNIIKVFDFNHDGDTYYMVLEYVPGETLQDRLKRLNEAGRRMPLSEVIDITASICDAVDYAHRRGMIHRDIKPANVMLSTQGRAILMDFGVAKILGGEQHTATGAVIGTALYMSPEQARGERPDERADIYSLGVMLFEMISGRPPFEADSAMTTMMMHVSDPVPDLSELAPGIPPGLKAIVEKALAKNREDRFQTAAQMAAALRNLDAQLRGGAEAGATMLEQPEAPSAPSPEGTFIEQPGVASEAAFAGTAAGSAAAPEQTFVEAAEAPAPAPPSPPADATRSPQATRQRVVAPARPEVEPAAAPARAGKGGLPLVLIGIGGGVLALVVLIGGFVIFGSGLLGGGGGSEEGASGNAPEGGGEVIEAVALQETPTPTEAPPTESPPPTETPTPDFTPTPTDPAGPYVRINNITLEGNQYVVDYETFGFTEQLPGMHIHFFFDTVPVEQAGLPGGGPWYVYGGPRPFSGYGVGDRPAAATQMCARVANPDHTLYASDSGNCVELP